MSEVSTYRELLVVLNSMSSEDLDREIVSLERDHGEFFGGSIEILNLMEYVKDCNYTKKEASEWIKSVISDHPEMTETSPFIGFL